MAIKIRTPSDPPQSLAGTWRVEAGDSHARFTARTLAGLVKVQGRFRTLTGTMSLDEQGTSGTLVIDAASIDTGNRRRDRHLRSSDFFAAEKHPELRYEVDSLAHDGEHVSIDGELVIAGARTRLPLAAELRQHDNQVVELACSTRVDRFAVGVRGARGVVPRTVDLDVALRLRRAG
jgi:polyisoprenoid-binding protein YceI